LEIYDPLWLRTVDPNFVVRLFPKAAAEAGLKTGMAVVHCTVAHDGSLKDCAVDKEDPPGLGFGEAALLVAGVTAMNPWTAQGEPVDGAHVSIPIRLKLPDDAPAAAATPAPAKP
jgi:protein TonB